MLPESSTLVLFGMGFVVLLFLMALVGAVVFSNRSFFTQIEKTGVNISSTRRTFHPDHSPQMPAMRRGTEAGRVGRALPGLPAAARHRDRRRRAAGNATVYSAHDSRPRQTFSATRNSRTHRQGRHGRGLQGAPAGAGPFRRAENSRAAGRAATWISPAASPAKPARSPSSVIQTSSPFTTSARPAA